MVKGDPSVVVAYAAAGWTQAQIAEAAGISVNTVARRLADPEVKAGIARVRAAQLDRVVGRLGEITHGAIDRLEVLLGDASPIVALRAVELVLHSAERFRLLHDQEVRITALEAAQQAAARPDGGWPDSGYIDPAGRSLGPAA